MTRFSTLSARSRTCFVKSARKSSDGHVPIHDARCGALKVNKRNRLLESRATGVSRFEHPRRLGIIEGSFP